MLVYSLKDDSPISYFRSFENGYVKMTYSRNLLEKNLEDKVSIWVKNKKMANSLIENWNEFGLGKWKYKIEEIEN